MNVVFLDCTQNYSYQFTAANTKTELLAKGLTLHGDKCTIINNVMGFTGVSGREQKMIDGIGTVITYPYVRFPEIGYVRNVPALYKDLKKLAGENQKNIMILESQYVHIYFTYVVLAKMLGYKIAVISHEWLPVIPRKHWIQNVSAKIYGPTFGRGVDAILPISHYISERIKHFKKKELMTPILADFSNVPKTNNKDGYLLYCVFAYYHRVINMMIDAYCEYHANTDTPLDLILVLSGPQEQIDIVAKHIELAGMSEFIKIKTKLPYRELIETYQGASGLIIPLDPGNEQDKARFSQKIAEYLSVGVPVISNEVGEIPYYFKNGENILTCSYDSKGFSEIFQWVQNNPIKAKEIGENGRKLGQHHFNYKDFGKKFHTFLKEL